MGLMVPLGMGETWRDGAWVCGRKVMGGVQGQVTEVFIGEIAE